ncbi:hypothetical protein [Deinococcus humi]|uniref:Uncharacterized protein n=1 Tax=Deinococcus humi TaxID=662880 RepID=A0A7W8JUV5_9DEIO|nr:hypothetical protein [Deinococcus humi]MBB5362276.1 hypothetical protein [Deinococcus humi]GGO21227.1 hypothetical protein GCM10008949_07230 [Deinococcus humi]
MQQQEGTPEVKQRGPAPSVSRPLLFLVLLSVVAVLAGLTASVDPDDHALKPVLIISIVMPSLFAWWFWGRYRQHPHLGFVLGLAFLAVQCLFGLSQLVLVGDAPGHSQAPISAQLGTLTAGLGFVGGSIYLWARSRQDRQI